MLSRIMNYFDKQPAFTNQLPLPPLLMLFQILASLESTLGMLSRRICLFLWKLPNCLRKTQCQSCKFQSIDCSPPICGTHFAETKLVASIVCNPVFDNRLISSIFTDVGTIFGSFCNPSLGPTSTILTELILLRKTRKKFREII